MYYTVFSLISDNTRLYEANAIPRNELEKYFTAVEQTLRKQYPGEDDAWYGPSPLVLATEALQDYKSRQGPPPLMEGETKVCDSESDSNRDSVRGCDRDNSGEDEVDDDYDDEHEDEDDMSLPPAYEGHELPSTMPANYLCYYICRRLNPRDIEEFCLNFNMIVLGRHINAVDVYHDNADKELVQLLFDLFVI